MKTELQVERLYSQYNTFNYENGPYNTRTAQRNLLEIPRINYSHSRQAFRYTGVIKYNNIPEYIKTRDNYETYKQRYKKFLLEQNVFYY